MPIAYLEDTAVLSGTVSVEDAETLLEWLQKAPAAWLDLAACTHLHAANLQVLMAARVRVAAWPADNDLKLWLMATTGMNPEGTTP